MHEVVSIDFFKREFSLTFEGETNSFDGVIFLKCSECYCKKGLIYVGDIISCDNCLPDRHKRYEVKFDEGIFGVKIRGEMIPLPVFSEHCHTDKHGNIYENPELLKGAS